MSALSVRRQWFCLVLVLIVGPSLTWGADKKKKTPKFRPADVEFFEKQVRPILVRRCYSCHSSKAKKLQGKLRLDSRAGVLKGGETGAAIQPGKPAKSLLVGAINYGDVFQMPPKSKLPKKEIAILTRWVKIGAPWTRETAKLTALSKVFDLKSRKASHWAWRPLRNVRPAAVKLPSWTRDPLDQFILARLEAAGLTPTADASKSAWIRRVYFDLVGLPPTPAQVRAFLADKSAKSFEKVVNQALKSPHFGERWARHWMDLVRYAETFGHEFDYPLRHAYRYRDYLIRAFNADVPYNQFIVEHIAGDLIRQPRRHAKEDYNESILGTGFWMLGEMTHSPVDVRDDEARRIDNQLDVMGKTFLGLTIGCARCHDHKFDAISARDYYALVGFMQSSDRSTSLLDPGKKIATAIEQIDDVRGNADTAMKGLPKGTDRLGRYLMASRAVLQKNPAAGSIPSLRVEAEKLRVLKHSSGKVMRQKGGWFSGGSQLWWIDSKIGGQLDLEIQAPATGVYTLSARLIESFDYGIAQFSLDGKALGKPIDLFHPKARPTPLRVLAKQKLSAGKHTLSIKITGNNKRSRPRHMVGFDYLQLVADAVQQKANASIAKVAKQHKLDPAELSKWVKAFSDRQVQRADHPLNLWHRLIRVKDAAIATTLAKHRDKVTAEAKSNKQSKVFVDFSQGGLKNWRRTGQAFGSELTKLGEWDSLSRLIQFARPGLAHSGNRSNKLHGILRSPTFTLSHRFVDYHVAARGAQLRVIIDGYTMNAFNGLLFGGASVSANTDGKMRWVRQGGDIGRYIGHRAHLEIIDHGDGFIAVDQIRFTNGHRPQPQSEIANRLAKKKLTSAQQVSDEFQRLLGNTSKGWIKGRPQVELAMFRNWLLRHDLVKSSRSVETAVASAKKDIETIERSMPRPLRALAIADGTAEDEFVFIRGNHKTPGPRIQRRFLEALGGTLRKIGDRRGSGRMSLAMQIADPRNPLTSRVIVNRIWHHLTGRGIVGSVDNFGVLGERPTHPQLLDHLATTFVRDGWSLKGLMKRIVLSSTYRMSSKPTAKGTKLDPENRLLHRMRIRRLSGEAIRDSILSMSGRLDTKMFGPSVPVHVTSHMQGRGRPRSNGPLDGKGRRSLYIEIRRNFLSPMMLAFDSPIPFNTMGRRNQSNVPAQALILMNDPLVTSQAKLWGRNLAKSADSVEQRIGRMYMRAFSRPPSKNEIAAAKEFIQQQGLERKLKQGDELKNAEIWGDLSHVMFNVKEFIFLR